MSDDQDYKVLEEVTEDTIEPWEEGLTPVKRFEKLIEYGQVNKLLNNSFFKSLDRAGQVDAICKSLDRLISQLDRMAQELMKVSSTHPEGVKINRTAATLAKLKVKIMDDFAKGVNVVAEISHSSKGKGQF